MTDDASDRVPDLLVEQLVLGELSDADAAAVRARLGATADARIAEVEASNVALLEKNPPERMAAQIHQRLRALPDAPAEQPARWGWWVGGGLLAAAAAAVLVVVLPGDEGPTEPPGEQVAVVQPPDVVRSKGDPAIVLHKQVEGRGELLAPGATVSPGDAIRVAYRASGAAYGVLVSLDGAGAATLHFPETAGEPTALVQTGNQALHTFDLDDAPDFERFFFVTADAPLDVDAVMQATEALGKNPKANSAALQLSEPTWSVAEFPLVRVATP
ncbi:MAG: ActD-like protein [Myxococcota bacterium]